nr:hypothetical protein [Tanacetum cinerariifolium]
YVWPTTQTLSSNCGTCMHVLASTTVNAGSVLEQVEQAHREKMITHGCCRKKIWESCSLGVPFALDRSWSKWELFV